MRRPLVSLLATIALSAASRDGLAEDRPLPTLDELDHPEGFHATADLGATISLSDNRNVVGQTEGSTVTFGYKLDVAATFAHDSHEWRGNVFVGQSLSKLPHLPDVIKSQDTLRFETLYLYHLVDWLGPYVRLSGTGPILASFDDRAEPTAFVIAQVDGTSRTVTTTHLPLTEVLRPFSLMQSAGPFARILRREEVNLEARTGVAARETFADGQLAIDDDGDTAPVEVKELESFQQVGIEAALALWGRFRGERISYKAGVQAMVPFYHGDTKASVGRSAFDLTNIDAFANVSFKLVSWASIDYDVHIIRSPQLIDTTQIQNNLLLTFGVTADSK